MESSVTNDTQPVIIVSEDQCNTQPTKPVHNPWEPISDEIEAALEIAVEQTEPVSDDPPLEFTPATARRTDTDVMAARLPKIPLKPGRFRLGKPIPNRSTTDAANEYRPLAASQPSSK